MRVHSHSARLSSTGRLADQIISLRACLYGDQAGDLSPLPTGWNLARRETLERWIRQLEIALQAARREQSYLYNAAQLPEHSIIQAPGTTKPAMLIRCLATGAPFVQLRSGHTFALVRGAQIRLIRFPLDLACRFLVQESASVDLCLPYPVVRAVAAARWSIVLTPGWQVGILDRHFNRPVSLTRDGDCISLKPQVLVRLIRSPRDLARGYLETHE